MIQNTINTPTDSMVVINPAIGDGFPTFSCCCWVTSVTSYDQEKKMLRNENGRGGWRWHQRNRRNRSQQKQLQQPQMNEITGAENEG